MEGRKRKRLAWPCRLTKRWEAPSFCFCFFFFFFLPSLFSLLFFSFFFLLYFSFPPFSLLVFFFHFPFFVYFLFLTLATGTLLCY